jgi:biotin transport system substrate-specific component
VASFITGALIEYLPGKLPLVLRHSVSLSIGAAAIYVPGIYWLSHVTGLDIPAALAVGLYPFIVGDAVKVVAGTMLCMSLSQVPQVWRPPTRD